MSRVFRRILHHIYLTGYTGKVAPKILRKTFARSRAHRAWLLGKLGYFREGEKSHGPCNPYLGANVTSFEGQ